MSDETYPDVEGGLRAFLRADAGIVAATGDPHGVWFGIPKNATEAYYPLIAIMRVGGGDDPSDIPLDRPLIQLDCWGSLHASGGGDKASATTLVNALRSALRSVRGRIELASGIRAFGFNVESSIWLPDPDNDRPRYVVTTDGTAISA